MTRLWAKDCIWLWLLLPLIGCGRNTSPSSLVILGTAPADNKGKAGGIECALQIEQHGGAVQAHLSFTNITNSPSAIPNRNLLREREVTFAPFIVKRDGVSIMYNGVMVKRGPFSDDEWYRLQPGEKYETQVSISRYYDVTAAGSYTVQYLSVSPLYKSQEMEIIQSNKVTYRLDK